MADPRILGPEESGIALSSDWGWGRHKLSFSVKNTQTRFVTLTGGQKMNIKSLLLGSAAAAVAVSAQAADAIIIAEPEPMEYVRICDTYGTGFFYIPGTETCLKVGGYVRYEMRYRDVDAGGFADGDTFGKFARFAPSFDARTATEWGTLRSFAEVEF